jgi:hypothetical protein
VNIEAGQRWYRNSFETGRGGRNPFRKGESVVIVGCPPLRTWVSFRRESTGSITGGYHPRVFEKYFAPNPQGVVLFEDGKYKLTINDHQFTGRGLPALAGRGSPSPFVVDLVSGVCIINM